MHTFQFIKPTGNKIINGYVIKLYPTLIIPAIPVNGAVIFLGKKNKMSGCIASREHVCVFNVLKVIYYYSKLPSAGCSALKQRAEAQISSGLTWPLKSEQHC